MHESQAIILFAHGARDPRWKEPLLRIQQLLTTGSTEGSTEGATGGSSQQPDGGSTQHAALRPLRVELAFLERMEPSLTHCVDQLCAAGIGHITVVPVFLGAGGHVQSDLPELLAQCRAQHPQAHIYAKPAVGESQGVLRAIAAYCIQE